MSQELSKLEEQYQLGVLAPSKLLDYYKTVDNEKYLKFRAELGYVVETLDLPMPTEDQTKRFVDYVANAHSWYKHLHPVRTSPFAFYLDRYVMMLRVPDGSIVDAKEGDLFHYSNMPTQEYRKKYGYWNYAEGYHDLYVLAENKTSVIIPKSLVKLGTADLTSNTFGSVDLDTLASIERERSTPGLTEYRSNYLDSVEQTEIEHQKMFDVMKFFLKELESQRNNFRLQ